jgi:hypothetical protein
VERRCKLVWRKKKFIFGLLIAVILVAASLGGIALAQGSEEDDQSKTLMARAAEILGIDQQQLEDAFEQARTEMQQETLDKYLQGLVDEGKITEEEAARYKEWIQSKPDMAQLKEETKNWMEAKPDIPGIFGQRNIGGFRGLNRMGIFGRLDLPLQ